MKTLYVVQSFWADIEVPDECTREQILEAYKKLTKDQYTLEGTIVMNAQGTEITEIEPND